MRRPPAVPKDRPNRAIGLLSGFAPRLHGGRWSPIVGLSCVPSPRLIHLRSGARIAFTERGLPAIQPVNFTVDGSNAIIRTSGGGKLAAVITGAMVAFEADQVDAAIRSGWSVVVVSHACLIRDIDELVALAGPDSHPWVPGRTNHVIRIKTERITGRRIVPA